MAVDYMARRDTRWCFFPATVVYVSNEQSAYDLARLARLWCYGTLPILIVILAMGCGIVRLWRNVSFAKLHAMNPSLTQGAAGTHFHNDTTDQ